MRFLSLALLICLATAVRLRADTNAPPAAVSAPARLAVAESPEQVLKEYQKLLAEDDAAQAEVDQRIQENRKFAEKGAGVPEAELRQRIEIRLAPVRKAYEDFLQRHPEHVRARLAYGSLLNDLQDDFGAAMQWEKARELSPKNPATWNNLGNHYAAQGPVKRGFEYFAKALELKPGEPVYARNLGNAILNFRKEAAEFYSLSEQAVLEKALALLRQAQKGDPANFPLATEIAQTYYGFRPRRPTEAIQAWETALKLAGDELEREGIRLHLARVKVAAGRTDEARRDLDAITNARYADLKKGLAAELAQREGRLKGTNQPPATAGPEAKSAP